MFRAENRKSSSIAQPHTIKFSWTYFGEACGVPFNVDLVSDAKCHERVFAGGVPWYKNIHSD
jgi:hypothetical protein